MKISGFTFARNLIRLDYPFIEAIRSILPIVDEFIVNVGPDEDGTLEAVEAIGDAKIKIVRSQWNQNFPQGGYVLTQQTNIALFNCTGDWAFCIQADEIIHEDDHDRLVRMMERYVDDDEVEGLGFKRLNFYGDYQTILDVHPWNTGLITRIVKPHKFALSRADSNEFCVHPKYKEKGRAIHIADTGASLFHYMDVKTEKPDDTAYYYQKYPRQFVSPFRESHPAIMRKRIAAHPVTLDHNSPDWRTTLTAREKRQLFKSSPLARRLRDLAGRRAYKLVRT